MSQLSNRFLCNRGKSVRSTQPSPPLLRRSLLVPRLPGTPAHEHLLAAQRRGVHIVLHDPTTAPESVLCLEQLEDAARPMPLLHRSLLIVVRMASTTPSHRPSLNNLLPQSPKWAANPSRNQKPRSLIPVWNCWKGRKKTEETRPIEDPALVRAIFPANGLCLVFTGGGAAAGRRTECENPFMAGAASLPPVRALHRTAAESAWRSNRLGRATRYLEEERR